MTLDKARNEAQNRANRTGCTVFVMYNPDSMALDYWNRYIACYPIDTPAHAELKEEITPSNLDYWNEFYQ